MEPTKGYRSSEFWLLAAAQVLSFLFAAGVVADGSTLEKALTLVATVLGALGYAVSRSMVKVGASKSAAVAALAKAPPGDPT